MDAVLRELENELLDVVDAIEEGAIAARGRQRLIEVSACTRTRCTSLPSQPCSDCVDQVCSNRQYNLPSMRECAQPHLHPLESEGGVLRLNVISTFPLLYSFVVVSATSTCSDGVSVVKRAFPFRACVAHFRTLTSLTCPLMVHRRCLFPSTRLSCLIETTSLERCCSQTARRSTQHCRKLCEPSCRMAQRGSLLCLHTRRPSHPRDCTLCSRTIRMVTTTTTTTTPTSFRHLTPRATTVCLRSRRQRAASRLRLSVLPRSTLGVAWKAPSV